MRAAFSYERCNETHYWGVRAHGVLLVCVCVCAAQLKEIGATRHQSSVI
jgi:hypothetical protein